MIVNRIKINSPVGIVLEIVGIIIFIVGLFTSIYFISHSNYFSALWIFLGGLLSFSICSGLAELIYQLLKLRRRIIEMLTAKEEKKW
ncbi:MAG: hypothetical protein KKF62_01510 [Bacteroidetes bacterium]|nr:hypothetical protein [Bacteroidota bacterium]MBU1114483.1 hypothetical protein [Bacteroidota bacterium]MBU1799917.1 hypothetical protein [Bacteroidota bacterium]